MMDAKQRLVDKTKVYFWGYEDEEGAWQYGCPETEKNLCSKIDELIEIHGLENVTPEMVSQHIHAAFDKRHNDNSEMAHMHMKE